MDAGETCWEIAAKSLDESLTEMVTGNEVFDKKDGL